MRPASSGTQPGQASQHRGLARTVRSEKGDHLAGFRRRARQRRSSVAEFGVAIDAEGRLATRTTGRSLTPRRRPSHRSRRRDQHRERDRDEHEASTIASSGWSRGRGRRRAASSGCAPGKLPGERDRRAELAQRARPRQHRAGDERRAGSPAASPGGTCTTVTRRVCAPRPRSGCRAGGSAASTVITRNGMATNVWATIDPGRA